MRKLYRYPGRLGYYTKFVLAYNIKDAMRSLRGLGYHLGKDFVYCRFDL